jgi:HPt (histidine-containing phosphotransfer) domain-containing protein
MSISSEIDGFQGPITVAPETTDFATVRESVDMAVLTSFEESQLDGEPDLILELIELYLTETVRLLITMREAQTNKDELSLKRAAHSLRGSSSSLGILQMAHLCDKLERTESKDMFVIALGLLECIEQEFARVSQILLAERQRRGE